MEKLYGKWRKGDPYSGGLSIPAFRKLMRKAERDNVKKPHNIRTKKVRGKIYYRFVYEGVSK